ncbi:Hypothetical_protein [Hexamita inflata]|uniref:Hypothetical_protein n=1 Tax=Hexamita inflata TaxID=28002 RepID=A0AA86NFA7_9EUKA|nr:Hypothetical protein HINF_LOCUS6307 [Hexamita inflata]
MKAVESLMYQYNLSQADSLRILQQHNFCIDSASFFIQQNNFPDYFNDLSKYLDLTPNSYYISQKQLNQLISFFKLTDLIELCDFFIQIKVQNYNSLTVHSLKRNYTKRTITINSEFVKFYFNLNKISNQNRIQSEFAYILMHKIISETDMNVIRSVFKDSIRKDEYLQLYDIFILKEMPEFSSDKITEIIALRNGFKQSINEFK